MPSPATCPRRVDIQVPNPVTVQDQQAEQRAVISDREPHLLVVKDSAHPVPDLIARMHQRRNLRNRMMASAQVYLGRDIRVGTCAPSQPQPGIHPPIVDQNAVILQGAPPTSHSSAAVRITPAPRSGNVSASADAVGGNLHRLA